MDILCRSTLAWVEQAGRTASARRPIRKLKRSLREIFIEFSSERIINPPQPRGQREMAALDIGEMAYDECPVNFPAADLALLHSRVSPIAIRELFPLPQTNRA